MKEEEVSSSSCCRAYNENKSFVKVEYYGKSILTVLAIPVESNKGRVVVELMKDTTDNPKRFDKYATIDILQGQVRGAEKSLVRSLTLTPC
jgi:hypothetical protein